MAVSSQKLLPLLLKCDDAKKDDEMEWEQKTASEREKINENGNER